VLYATRWVPFVVFHVGLAPVYAPTRVKALEGKDASLVRSGQHHTLVLTHAGVGCGMQKYHVEPYGLRSSLALCYWVVHGCVSSCRD